MGTCGIRSLPFLGALVSLVFAVPLEGQSLDQFLDNRTLQEIRVRMDPAAWQTLKDKYLENTYYRCDFEWRGVAVASAGIRSRGSGSRTPIKPGLGIDFSRYDGAQRFLGLKSIVLRNLVQDPSGLRERLAELLFARMGLPHQREAHARLYINGKYEGLYLIVEPIDKRFLATRYGEDTGYLFEMRPWTGFRFQYLGGDPSRYVPGIFEPKTHEDDPQPEKLVDFLRAIDETPDAEFAATMARYTDLATFVTHIAIDQFLANWDSMLNAEGMSNFYLYRRTSDDRWTFIVWDEDTAFSIWQRPVFEGTEENVLIRRALAIPELRRHYVDTLRQAAAVAANDGWMMRELELAYEQVRTAALEDPNRACLLDGRLQYCGPETFEPGMAHLREVVRERIRFVLDQTAMLFERPQGTPWFAGAQAVNPGNQLAVLTPGALASVRLDGSVDGSFSAWAFPLPNEIEGVSVLVGGRPAPLLSLHSGQVLFQVPCDVPCGPTPVALRHHDRMSNTFAVEVQPSNPGILGVTHLTGVAVTPWQPARRGETLLVFATGAGRLPVIVKAGVPAPYDPLVTLPGIAVTIGGTAAKVQWAGFVPGLAGINQINIEVPANLPPGSRQSLVIWNNGEPGTSYPVDILPGG